MKNRLTEQLNNLAISEKRAQGMNLTSYEVVSCAFLFLVAYKVGVTHNHYHD